MKNNLNKRKGEQAELNLNWTTGVPLVKGSGSGRVKGDLQNKELMIESKTTTKDSISVKYEWLQKLEKQTPIGKNKVLIFSFIDSDGEFKKDGVWVLMPFMEWYSKYK